MRRIHLRRGARQRGARIGEQPLYQRNRPRRGGDELARARAQPQGELQHVEGRLRLAPLGQLVAPGGIELRPAQAFGVLGRERLRDRPVRPLQEPARRGPDRPLGARRDPQQPRNSLDHHLAHVVLALADQRDAAMPARGVGRRAVRERAHPLGAEPGLAGAAAAEDEPGGPRTAVVGGGRRLLMRMREHGEILSDPRPPAQARNLLEHGQAQSGLRRTRQCGAQGRDGTRRCRGACRHRHRNLHPAAGRSAAVPAPAGFASASRACVPPALRPPAGAAVDRAAPAPPPRRRAPSPPAVRCARSALLPLVPAQAGTQEPLARPAVLAPRLRCAGTHNH